MRPIDADVLTGQLATMEEDAADDFTRNAISALSRLVAAQPTIETAHAQVLALNELEYLEPFVTVVWVQHRASGVLRPYIKKSCNGSVLETVEGITFDLRHMGFELIFWDQRPNDKDREAVTWRG